LSKQHPHFSKEGVSKILDAFVTEEGTKRPVLYERKGELIIPSAKFLELLPKIEPLVLSNALSGLEQRRILRFTDATIELTHDSIAALIDENRTEQQRQLNQILRRIKNIYIEYRDSQVYLNEKQLNVIDEYLPLLELEKPIEEFIEKSRTEAVRQRKFREEQKRAELRKKLLPIIAALAILAIIASAIAIFQRNEAVKAKKLVEQNAIFSDMNYSEIQMRQGSYQRAIDFLDDAITKIDTLGFLQEMQSELAIITSKKENYQELKHLMIQGDALLKVNDLTDRYPKSRSIKNLSRGLCIRTRLFD